MTVTQSKSGGMYQFECKCGCGQVGYSKRPDTKFINGHKNRHNTMLFKTEYAQEIQFCKSYMFNAKLVREVLQNCGPDTSVSFLKARKFNFRTVPSGHRDSDNKIYIKFGNYRLTFISDEHIKLNRDESGL